MKAGAALAFALVGVLSALSPAQLAAAQRRLMVPSAPWPHGPFASMHTSHTAVLHECTGAMAHPRLDQGGTNAARGKQYRPPPCCRVRAQGLWRACFSIRASFPTSYVAYHHLKAKVGRREGWPQGSSLIRGY